MGRVVAIYVRMKFKCPKPCCRGVIIARCRESERLRGDRLKLYCASCGWTGFIPAQDGRIV